MINELKLPVIGLSILLVGCVSDGASIEDLAQVKNIDIAGQCTLIVTRNNGNRSTFPLPAAGQTSSVDLGDHKVIAVGCPNYKGEGNVLNRCEAPAGTPVLKLRVQNVADPSGDYPGCNAN